MSLKFAQSSPQATLDPLHAADWLLVRGALNVAQHREFLRRALRLDGASLGLLLLAVEPLALEEFRAYQESELAARYLIEAGVLTVPQLAEAHRTQLESGLQLGYLLTQRFGLCSRETYMFALRQARASEGVIR